MEEIETDSQKYERLIREYVTVWSSQRILTDDEKQWIKDYQQSLVEKTIMKLTTICKNRDVLANHITIRDLGKYLSAFILKPSYLCPKDNEIISLLKKMEDEGKIILFVQYGDICIKAT